MRDKRPETSVSTGFLIGLQNSDKSFQNSPEITNFDFLKKEEKKLTNFWKKVCVASFVKKNQFENYFWKNSS